MKSTFERAVSRWILLVVLASMSCLAQAGPGTFAQLIVFLDTDASTATGCTLPLPSPPGGTFQGAERILTTVVNTSVNPPTVGAITEVTCVSPPSSLSAPVTISAGGWPVGIGLGTAGFDVIETFIPAGATSGSYRIGFLYSDSAVVSGNDALLTTAAAGGVPIIFGFDTPAPAIPVPTLMHGAIVLLALLLGGAAVVALRRYKTPATLALAVVAVMLAATAVAITLDGLVGDWAGIPPVATDPVGDAPPRADISAGFAKFEPSEGRIYFRADVQTTSAPAITSANSATFTVGVANSFTVTTTGVPTPAIMQTGALPGGVLFTDNGTGTGTLAGTATQGGTFPLTFTATNAAGSSAPQSFTLTVLPGAQTITFTTTAPAGAQVARSPYPVAAVSSALLPVALTIDASASAICTLSGSTVYFTGAGTCVINANAAGNANFSAAPQVQQSFAVIALTQSTVGPPFSDSFTQAESSLSGSWVEQAGHYIVAANAATGQAATNIAVLNGLNTATASVNVDVSMPTGSFAGVVARSTGLGGANMYLGNIERAPDGSCQAAIFSVIGGVSTQIGTGGPVATCASGTVNFTVSGTTLTLKFNATTVATATDSSIASAGTVGVRTSAGVTIDNFSVN